MASRPDPSVLRRAGRILSLLVKAHPDADCELHADTPFELVVATILSAQCTDARVNAVSPGLFSAYPTAEALAAADPEAVEHLVRPTGFFRSKTRSLIACARALVERHSGEVPCTMAELTRLPGVGRKTANVVLGHACGVPAGVVVDTHVRRVAGRLGLTSHEDPEEIEQDLQSLFPSSQWTRLGDTLIFHGRRICHARRPACDACPVASLCPSRVQATPATPVPRR